MPTLPPRSPLRADDPRRLGRYSMLGRLGRGAQGVVYLGRTPDGRMVALKLLHPDRTERPGSRKRLAKEAAAARRIRGRCTARILDVDVSGPRPYIVTEYVPGPSLHRRVHERGALSGAPLDRLMIGTATALVAIHAAGIVHRDLKPANVVLGPEGPRVIDFGVAHMESAAATLTGAPVGTPAYMAPEQVAGESAAAPADVFAWASTMVYAATGEAPFGRDNASAVMNRVAHHEPDLADLHGPVLELLHACLSKNPADRPTAEHVLRRLLELSTRKPAGRSRTAMLAAGTRAASSPGDRGPATGSSTGPGGGSAQPAAPKVPEWMRGRKPPAVRRARDLPSQPQGPHRARARGEDASQVQGRARGEGTPRPQAQGRAQGGNAPRGPGRARGESAPSSSRPSARTRVRRPWAGGDPARRRPGENWAHSPGVSGMSAARRHGYVIAVIITMLIGLALGLTSPWASSSASNGPSPSATP